ncbi:MAG: ABC transporter substrate-binding protein, partial [Lachnospiraceae bacterium]|nr:ABC transporter substrate-binding protein [Lachnospiraceae bacterium]
MKTHRLFTAAAVFLTIAAVFLFSGCEAPAADPPGSSGTVSDASCETSFGVSSETSLGTSSGALSGTSSETSSGASSETSSELSSGTSVSDDPSDLKDGVYLADAKLLGGSGRAGITSPMTFTVKDHLVTADIEFSSPNYDYMIFGGKRYEASYSPEGNSLFRIPVTSFDSPLSVVADTTAMSVPHEIAYEIHIDPGTIRAYGSEEQEDPDSIPEKYHEITGINEGKEKKGSFKPEYAEGFSWDILSDGRTVLYTADAVYTVLPEGWTGEDKDTLLGSVIKRPLDSIYMASSSSMDFFTALNMTENIKVSAFDRDVWCDPEVREAMDRGEIIYAGKYSAPDFELILKNKCSIAVENTMIYHRPEVMEMLKANGLSCLVDRSSYENDPLGRAEWVRFYGLIAGREDEAEKVFSDVKKGISLVTSRVKTPDGDRPKVAFFSVTPAGYANVRRPGDYVSRMIEMAGG